MNRRVRIEIRELRISGASPLDAARLRDALERELAIAATALAPQGAQASERAAVRLPPVAARQRIESAAGALAAAILAQVAP